MSASPSDALRAEITRRRPDLRIDAVGPLVRGRGVEAVCTDPRTGRQGLWPVAWVENGADSGESTGMTAIAPRVRANTVREAPVKVPKSQLSLF